MTLYKNKMADRRIIRLVLMTVPIFLVIFMTGCQTIQTPSESWNAEGVEYYQQGNYREAQNKFEESIRQDPNNAAAYYNLASTFQRQASTTRDSGLESKAENYYRACLDRNPSPQTTVCCYRGIATIMNQRNQKDEAVQLLRSWESRNPNAVDPKLELAYLLEAQGKNAEAVQELQKAADIAPNDYRIYYKSGTIREKMGDNRVALDQLQMAGRLNPSDSEIASRITALRTRMTAGDNNKSSSTNVAGNYQKKETGSVATTQPAISMTPPDFSQKEKTLAKNASVNVQTTGAAATLPNTAAPVAAAIPNKNTAIAPTLSGSSKETASQPPTLPTGTGTAATQAPSPSSGVTAKTSAPVPVAAAPFPINSAKGTTSKTAETPPTVTAPSRAKERQELLGAGPPTIDVSAGF